MRSLALVLAFVLALALPVLAGPSYRYSSGQQVGAVVVPPGAANTATIIVPANRVLTILSMQGDPSDGWACAGRITVEGVPAIRVYFAGDPGSEFQHFSSFVLLGPATLQLAGEDRDHPLLLTYALTRVRTVSP
jgi:hypothetical protein